MTPPAQFTQIWHAASSALRLSTYEDLIELGSFAEARKNGKLRSEGKTYMVADGDTLEVLFNV